MASAAATVCVGPPGTGICATGTTPCVITAAHSIAPDSIIDCGALNLQISGPTGELNVTGGSFALRANNLTIDQGRRIIANEATTAQVGMEIELAGSLVVHGQLVARNARRGSSVSVTAGGSISLLTTNPAIDVAGTQLFSDGGDVFLTSGAGVLINKRIDMNGKEGGDENNINSGGRLVVDAAGDIRVEEEIRAHGR